MGMTQIRVLLGNRLATAAGGPGIATLRLLNAETRTEGGRTVLLMPDCNGDLLYIAKRRRG